MVRPRVYSDAQMTAALAKTKGLVFLAAKALGCKPDTIRERARVSPAVAECIASQRGQAVDVAELRLFRAVEKSQPWAVALVLKTLGKDRGYVERSEQRHGGDESAPPIRYVEFTDAPPRPADDGDDR